MPGGVSLYQSIDGLLALFEVVNVAENEASSFPFTRHLHFNSLIRIYANYLALDLRFKGFVALNLWFLSAARAKT
jgi:hypothetical protein